MGWSKAGMAALPPSIPLLVLTRCSTRSIEFDGFQMETVIDAERDDNVAFLSATFTRCTVHGGTLALLHRDEYAFSGCSLVETSISLDNTDVTLDDCDLSFTNVHMNAVANVHMALSSNNSQYRPLITHVSIRSSNFLKQLQISGNHMEHSSVTMIDLNTSFFSGKKGKVDTSNFINTTLSLNAPYSAAVITSSNFMNNTQNRWTLHVIAQQISLSNNTFLGNEGRDENGILFLYPQQRGLTVHNCTFVDNRVIAQNDHPESSTLTVKGDQLELVDNIFSCNSLIIGSAHNSLIKYPPIFVEDLSDAALSSIKLHTNEILDCEIEVHICSFFKKPTI